jgi:TonB family protein
MSAASVHAVPTAEAVPRRTPRHPLEIPVDVTILRSGVPFLIPGRAVNVCEGGMAAILAGELRLGDSVGLEFRLPSMGLPMRTKAVVRHQARLRCGVEFVNLSREGQTMIQYWAALADKSAPRPLAPKIAPIIQSAARKRRKWRPALLRRFLWTSLAVFLTIAALGWWHWYHAWQELETVAAASSVGESEPTQVPADIMVRRVTHKVEPIDPDAAKNGRTQAVVLLDTVVGADGSVINVKAISGPDSLAKAAADAVRAWRFDPYEVSGRPEAVETTLAVQFGPHP